MWNENKGQLENMENVSSKGQSVMLMFVFCVECFWLLFPTTVRFCAALADQPSEGLELDSSKWAAKTPPRSLLNARATENLIFFPQAWETIVDAGTNPGNYNLSIGCSVALSNYSAALAKQEPWAVRSEC